MEVIMAQSTSRKTSITARRTYALLKGALFSQLAALPFEQLTLTDICNTALISRSTFYRYFEDKYDRLPKDDFLLVKPLE